MTKVVTDVPDDLADRVARGERVLPCELPGAEGMTRGEAAGKVVLGFLHLLGMVEWREESGYYVGLAEHALRKVMERELAADSSPGSASGSSGADGSDRGAS